MEIMIKATDKLTIINGATCRLWEGVTARGMKCKVFVNCLVAHSDDDFGQLKAEMKEMMPPGRYIPVSMIL